MTDTQTAPLTEAEIEEVIRFADQRTGFADGPAARTARALRQQRDEIARLNAIVRDHRRIIGREP